MWSFLECDGFAPEEDYESSIEEFTHVDAFPAPGATTWSFRKLAPTPRNGDGVVSLNDTRIMTGQEQGKVLGRLLEDGDGLCRCFGEPSVVIVDEAR